MSFLDFLIAYIIQYYSLCLWGQPSPNKYKIVPKYYYEFTRTGE